MIKNIQAEEIPHYIEKGALIIDIRESYETPKFQFPSHKNVPTSEIGDRLDEIPKTGDVLIYCHSGARSADLVATLNLHYGYENLLNVIGGTIMMSLKLPEHKL
ncbi:rhodanese-like domain-containing protein [Balneicella halophila]|uniref:rhodanese-like domain-containing protein n=1 Tax=Balneicella halophila TaxID=1537566 RepID=UPI000E30584A|nr:rhodanese-like domain-containing protein [Balneicella halophila]